MVGEISLLEMILDASPFVQMIVFVLVVMSVLCWAVVIQKIRLIKRTRKNIAHFRDILNTDPNLSHLLHSDIVKLPESMSRVFVLLVWEWNVLQKRGMSPIVRSEKLEGALTKAVDKESENLDTNLYILAIVGSSAPFIGLLGTVWGIMNSFVAISVNKQANLSVVAPGIAEALFVTAIGLIAAIPAMIAYNKFSHDVDTLPSEMDSVGSEVIEKVLVQQG